MTYRRLLFWRMALHGLPQPPARDERFVVATTDHAAELAAAMRMAADEVTQRMSWSSCHVGRVDGMVAAFGWVSSVDTRLGEIRSSVRPEQGEAYVWHCETVPQIPGARPLRGPARACHSAYSRPRADQPAKGINQASPVGHRGYSLGAIRLTPTDRPAYLPFGFVPRGVRDELGQGLDASCLSRVCLPVAVSGCRHPRPRDISRLSFNWSDGRTFKLDGWRRERDSNPRGLAP